MPLDPSLDPVEIPGFASFKPRVLPSPLGIHPSGSIVMTPKWWHGEINDLPNVLQGVTATGEQCPAALLLLQQRPAQQENLRHLHEETWPHIPTPVTPSWVEAVDGPGGTSVP